MPPMAASISTVPFPRLPPPSAVRSRRSVPCHVASESPPSSPASSDGGEAVSADCVVVGGGISGLCTAHALSSRHSADVLLTEAKPRVGGNIATVERDGFLWEEGPNSFQPSDPVLSIAVDSGLGDDLVFGDPNAPRFVLWNGKLRPVPSKLTDLPFFDLMSFGGKLRAGFGAIGIRPPPPGHEESVEEFVRRNLGDEVFERLIEPFCSGVYAGDPAKLSMKAAFGRVWKLEQNGGSIISGAFKAIQERKKSPKTPRDPNLPKPKGQTVASFRKGLGMLPDAISSRLGSKIKLSWKLTSIKKMGSLGYTLSYETPEGTKSVQTRSIVLTIPSYIASGLLRPLSECPFLYPSIDQNPNKRSPNAVKLLANSGFGKSQDISDGAADALSKFHYPPVAAVSVSYKRDAIREECLIDGDLKGFGQLIPRSQGVETLGTIYSSSLFPNRAPPGRVLLLNYIGGATNTGILSKTESELVEAVDRDIRKMLINPSAEDPLTLGVRVWPQAIPQFLVGHLDHLEAANCALSKGGFEGLFLGGNYVSGVALGRCVEGAFESAAQVSDFLAKYVYK